MDSGFLLELNRQPLPCLCNRLELVCYIATVDKTGCNAAVLQKWKGRLKKKTAKTTAQHAKLPSA